MSKIAQTYFISVSYKPGCYRHIKLSSDATLYDLHGVILYAFDFIDDHAHAFFLNNREWSMTEAYYADFIEDEEFFTKDYTLEETLSDKQKFKYVFDFGDNHSFQCHVLKINDDICNEPEIFRSVGDSPEQYPYFEDEDIEANDKDFEDFFEGLEDDDF